MIEQWTSGIYVKLELRVAVLGALVEVRTSYRGYEGIFSLFNPYAFCMETPLVWINIFLLLLNSFNMIFYPNSDKKFSS